MLQDRNGTRYHQTTPQGKLLLGLFSYMQIGRSLKEYDDHHDSVATACHWLSTLVIAGAGWWLAGLAIRPVYQSYQQMQQFTADAAHELRTPIASIRATVESVQMWITYQTKKCKTLSVVDRQNNRLAHLVQDLLLLSRMGQKVLVENVRSLPQRPN